MNFPADWKVSGAQAEGIQALLKRIPAEKKAGADLTWYHDLSDAQIAQCAKNPSLFVVRPSSPCRPDVPATNPYWPPSSHQRVWNQVCTRILSGGRLPDAQRCARGDSSEACMVCRRADAPELNTAAGRSTHQSGSGSPAHHTRLCGATLLEHLRARDVIARVGTQVAWPDCLQPLARGHRQGLQSGHSGAGRLAQGRDVSAKQAETQPSWPVAALRQARAHVAVRAWGSNADWTQWHRRPRCALSQQHLTWRPPALDQLARTHTSNHVCSSLRSQSHSRSRSVTSQQQLAQSRSALGQLARIHICTRTHACLALDCAE